MKPSSLAAAVGGWALALSLATAVALAEPDLTPLINTTCSYQQIVAALNAQAPELAQALSGRPQVQTTLQQFLALTPDRRQQVVQQAQSAYPQWQGLLGPTGASLLTQIANTWQNY